MRFKFLLTDTSSDDKLPELYYTDDTGILNEKLSALSVLQLRLTRWSYVGWTVFISTEGSIGVWQSGTSLASTRYLLVHEGSVVLYGPET